ncbi:hypothetical protein LAZ67_4001541 [Cordylochernes scorpioides]|uniref:RNA-directed DNA polymerase n=1 Tax=Cordylochernes scorpioides TaxID=51811 RepID=A0ABY6KC06_9ARAC|nr:hypothetical protein LAZ67_4001541 [Cordylochernes scorpioides]
MNNRSEATTQVSPLFCQNVVRNPSMFSGEISEDPQAWLKGYERVAKHNHWDDSLSLANVYFYLHGTAQRWYENNEENIPSWEIFKDQLGSVFGKKDNLRRQAEQKLKVRAQTRGETTEFYIQDVLRLCREVDAQMPEEERLSHLMKGVAEEVYRYLLPRDIATTDQFIAECRRVVALQGRRVTASKFERLPNVTSLGDLGDVTDLQSLIRQIVREEVQRALAPPREEPRISSLEEIVKEEVDKVLAPMSGINTFPMESAARSAPRNYRKNTWYAPKVEASGSRVEVRDTNEWRTPDGTPVCFHCGRPGHVVRYCRDRRRLLDERRDEMYQDRARTMTNSGRNNNSNDADQRVSTRRYRSPSPSPRRGSSPGRSATRRASQSPRLVKMTNNYIDIKVEGDTIRALVDSGASYSVISERFRVELKKTMFAETDVVLKVADDKVIKSKGRCTLKLEVNGHPENFEFVVLENCSHDVILGWDFFKATNAVIDCGLGELQLDDLPDLDAEGRDDGVYAIQDFVIPGRSSQRISVVNRSLVGIVNMEVTCSKELFIRKDVIFPSSLIEFEEGIGKIWITNGGLQPQMIPKGMNLGRMCDIETEHVCLLSVEPESFSRERREDDHSDYLLSLINPDLPKKKKEDLMGLLLSFKGVFLPTMKNANKVQNRVKHRIHTGDHPPIKQRPYRVSKREREIMQKEVDTMLERKVIQPSESPWSAPVVLVKKKDGTWRFCVDFRRLNHITKKDVYPLPRIDDVLDHLSSARYYSTMDLKTGYWQVEVDERDREKTAFVTPDGLYEFMVMPFGLCNAPATFERMMDNVLMGLKWNICLCYLDDIVVYSDTFEEHLERLSKVLSCLQQAGLTINPDKCLFGSTRIKILGHVVDKDGIQPDSEKVEAIKKFPVPKSVCDIQSYLGLCSYYRRFIKNFSKIAAPLQILLKKDQKFIWTQEQKDSFESLKKALMQKPVLGHFKESAITKLHTDASSYGLGAVLVQIQENQENPIAYASRTLSKAEKNYSTTERECLAVIWAIGKFRPYLYGRPFEVVSDHHSLCWLAGLKDPSGRLARWALKLQDFEATITYKSGVKHKDADCLSRYPLPESPALTSLTLVREQQNLDPDITKISNALNQGEGAERFEMKNGLLYKRNFDPLGRRLLLVIPKCMRPDILKEFHDVPTAGHLGFARTYDRIRKRYFWPGLYNSVRRYVAHCKECQRRKGENKLPAGKLIPIKPPSFPFQKIGMDLLGRFPLSDKGNRWIIVCTDYLTKYAIAKALPSGTAAEIATFILEEVILKHGAPREIITDRGRAFMSQMVKEVTSRCKISHLFTTAYHPQTNGLTERLNKTLGDMLSMYVDAEQRDWDSVLPYVIFAYNTAQQGSTRFSPFFLVHGREAETLLDVLLPYEDETSDHDFGDQMVTKAEEARQLARIHILRAQENNKYHYDQVHRSVEYRVGDLVWVFTPVRKTGLSEKLLKKYFGPYKITRKVSEVNYEVEALEQSSRRRRRSQKDVVHVLRMKPYRDPGQQLVTGDYNSWDSEDALSSIQLKAEEEQSILEVVSQPVGLVVLGQNCWAKAVVANHLLGQSLLPVAPPSPPSSPSPCWRMVRFKYGNQTQVSLSLPNSYILVQPLAADNRPWHTVPLADLELKKEEEDPALLSATLEVNIHHSLLRDDIQLIISPSNTAFDLLYSSCTEGLSPILIYAIGSETLSPEEVTELLELRKKAPKIPVFFLQANPQVVSDLTESEQHALVAHPQEVRGRAESGSPTLFQQLVGLGFLSLQPDPIDPKRSRRRSVPVEVESELVVSLAHFKKINDFIHRIFKQRLVGVLTTLNDLHTKGLRMFIMTAFDMTWDMMITPRRLEYARQREGELFDTLMCIANCKQDEIRQLIVSTIQGMKESLLEKAEDYTFQVLDLTHSVPDPTFLSPITTHSMIDPALSMLDPTQSLSVPDYA